MIEFPIQDLMSEETCQSYLLEALHPAGLICPHCQSPRRRLARHNQYYDSYRCRACERYYSPYTGTLFAKTRQPASKLVLLLRGVAKGEPTHKLAAELALNYGWVLELRHRIQTQMLSGLPTEPMKGRTFEIDELYQNAGEKRGPSPRSERSSSSPSQ